MLVTFGVLSTCTLTHRSGYLWRFLRVLEAAGQFIYKLIICSVAGGWEVHETRERLLQLDARSTRM